MGPTRTLSDNEKKAVDLALKEQEFWEKRNPYGEMVLEFQNLVGLIEHLGLHEALEGIFGQMDGSPDQQQARWDLRNWCDYHICELDLTEETEEE